MLVTLLVRPSLHFTKLHFTTLVDTSLLPLLFLHMNLPTSNWSICQLYVTGAVLGARLTSPFAKFVMWFVYFFLLLIQMKGREMLQTGSRDNSGEGGQSRRVKSLIYTVQTFCFKPRPWHPICTVRALNCPCHYTSCQVSISRSSHQPVIPVNQSLYWPAQAPMVPADWGSYISIQSTHAVGRAVSHNHRPLYPSGSIFGTHFC